MTNTIDNGQDTIDSRNIIERIEELEADCIQYTAGWNMTGCLCDSEPSGFIEFEDAKQSILDMLQLEADRLGEEASWQETAEDREKAEKGAEEVESILQDINLESGEFSVFVEPLNYWYWVSVNPDDPMPEDPDDAAELTALRDLAEQAEGYASDWTHGSTLIRDSYFKEYAQELAEDIGAINLTESWRWPHSCIDWNQAARELQMNYTSVEFDGVTYWVR